MAGPSFGILEVLYSRSHHRAQSGAFFWYLCCKAANPLTPHAIVGGLVL